MNLDRLRAVVDDVRAAPPRRRKIALREHSYLSTGEWLIVCLAIGEAWSIGMLGDHYPTIPDAWQRIGPEGQEWVRSIWETQS